MNKKIRIYALLGVLIVLCVSIWAVSHMEKKNEAIRISGDTILSIPAESVKALSWSNEQGDFSFSKSEDGVWAYEGDDSFPASSEAIDDVLSIFSDMRSDFTIEEVTDFSPYGLSSPRAVITLITDEGETLVSVGDLSLMDEERYISLGGDTVYLAKHDPMDEFSGTFADLIANDTVPTLSEAKEIEFSGAYNYKAEQSKEGDLSYSEDDEYYVFASSSKIVLDSSKVSKYLKTLSSLDLTDFVSYKATDDELADYWMDNPKLSVRVKYEDDEGKDQEFILNISSDPNEETRDKDDSENASDSEDEAEITAYARVGESSIIYRISADEYLSLMASSCDDLRHSELFYGDHDLVSAIDIDLDGETYHIASSLIDGVREYYMEDEDRESEETDPSDIIDISGILDAVDSLSAQSFSDEEAGEKEEISLRLYLENEVFQRVDITLFRYDASSCLSYLNGEPTALVPRSQAVDLIEAVYALVL